jgi:SAM-dependent methyltransferase
MSTDLAQLEKLITDPERISEWRRCVVTIDGRKLTAGPVALRGGAAVKLVEADGRRERTTTVAMEDWPARAAQLLRSADRVHVLGSSGDWHARRSKRGRWLISHGRPSAPAPERAELPAHDRERRHPLPPDDPEANRLLVATGLFSPEGRLRKPQAAKYRQVQHYLELLRPLPVWAGHERMRVVDAGCGKAYLSLALVAWARLQGLGLDLVGVDSNPEVLATVSAIAAELGYDASFDEATIWAYAREHEAEGTDLLVSLHACDTASDEALAAGVVLGADAIVLAPCCHRELARQLRRDEGWSDSVLRHGLLRDRFADVLTDALRALALEVFGYRAEVIEFVSAEHTAKNVMIRAVRRPAGAAADRARDDAIVSYDALADRWQVEPALRRLLADRWPSGPI